MKPISSRIIDAAAESFPMRGPVYEFGFSPAATVRRPASEVHNEPATTSATEQIDRLGDLDRLPFSDNTARTVVCENALQFAFEPRQAVDEMTRILMPGGLLVAVESTRLELPSAGERYWSIHPSAMGRLMEGLSGTLLGWIGSDAEPHTVFGIGCKMPMPAEFAQGVQPFLDRLGLVLNESIRRRGVLRSIKHHLAGWVIPSGKRLARRDDHRVQYALHLDVDEQSRPAILDCCLPPIKTGTRLDLSD